MIQMGSSISLAESVDCKRIVRVVNSHMNDQEFAIEEMKKGAGVIEVEIVNVNQIRELIDPYEDDAP
jgi:hypothetical protein